MSTKSTKSDLELRIEKLMSKQYEKYTLEEFITDDDFIQWAKYPTEELDIFWHSFIKREPQKATIVLNARTAVQHLAIVSKQNTPPNEAAIILTEIEDGWIEKSKTVLFPPNWKHWAMAASVLLILGLSVLWKTKQNSTDTPVYSEMVSKTQYPVKEVINTSKSELSVQLPDSSRAVLKPNSRLSFHETFEGKSREVYLAGEALFDVKKNTNKPFIVFANGLVTKVLGTSFSVKAFETDKEVVVNVKTGKVWVYSQKTALNQEAETSGVVLTPNQKVVFGLDDESLTRTLVEKPVLLLSNQELMQLTFKDAAVYQIFDALEKSYGVELIYDKEAMINCRLTTSLTNETLFEKLDIICAAIEAKYKVVDAKVIISSAGCN